MLTKICDGCGASFQRSTFDKRNKKFYCTKECFLSHKIKKVNKICCICAKEFIPANLQKTEAKRSTCPECREKVKVNCNTCNKEILIAKCRIRVRRNIHCSVACKAEGQKKDWDDLSRSMLKQKWIATFGESNFICARCGHNKSYNIVLHHKIYLINGGNSQPENLEPLCLNCHGTEHYGK
jgi:hypothetical protein